MFFSIEGRTAFITGGLSGIGLAVAKRFIAAGARVVVADIVDDETRAREVGAAFVHVDVSSAEQMAEALDIAERTVGRLDILVNNAGVGDLAPLESNDEDTWRRVIDVNLFGVVHGLAYGPRHMNDGSSIINTASQAAFVSAAGFGPYAASKAGVVSVTKTAAIELAPRGIRVNAICPTTVRTPMMADPDDPEFASVTICTQFGRPAETDDVVGVYHFLSAPESAFITGQSILVDGGWTAGESHRHQEVLVRAYAALRQHTTR